MTYERTRAELGLLGRADMLPHEDTLVNLMYSRALCSISVKVQTMLRTTETLSERDLTMGTVIDLYMRAAYRREQGFSGINSALRASAPQRPAPQPRRPPTGQPTAPTPPLEAAPMPPVAPRAPQCAPGAKHPPSKCWCLRWDGAPWYYHPHEPVVRLGAPVVAPAVVPADADQPPGAVPHLAALRSSCDP